MVGEVMNNYLNIAIVLKESSQNVSKQYKDKNHQEQNN